MKKSLSCLLAGFIMLFALSGCGSPAAQSNGRKDCGDRKIQIVATIFPPYDWVRQILGDRAENVGLTLLLENDVDLHSYQPTTDNMVTISSCDLFLYVDEESDTWAHDALKTATNQDMIVVNLLEALGDSVKVEEHKEGMEEDHDAADHDHEDGHDHDETELDEHVGFPCATRKRSARTSCRHLASSIRRTRTLMLPTPRPTTTSYTRWTPGTRRS